MTRQANILVIDKDPLIGESIKAALKDTEHAVMLAHSAAETLEALKKPFDLRQMIAEVEDLVGVDA